MKGKNGRKITVAIAFISAFVLLTAVASVTALSPVLDCACGDLCVNETGWWRDGGAFNENLSTPIQAAVDNATAGEIICVQNGTYNENVLVNKSLTIHSAYGSENCIVTANNSEIDVFTVTADWVNITGFTVQDATGDELAGIWLCEVEHCTISDNNATNNYCGIYLTLSSNNTLINNTANLNDYGIRLEESENNALINNTASSNDYNGIYLLLSSYYNNLLGNIANANGGRGIYLDDAANNNLTGNTATSNGYNGIYLSASQNNELLDNFVAGHKYSYFGPESFDVLLLTGASWTYQGKLSFRNYEMLELPLTHIAGTLTLRLSQHGHDSAYVDYVALKKGESLYEPATAVNLDSDADICYKLIAPDYDVCDAGESTLELTWDSVPADTTLVMRAMEEDLGPGHGSPIYYPLLREGRTLSHTLVNDGGIVVDGVLNESKAPTFSVFWRPDTPHPDGYTYGWLHADDQYVYAAIEVTADNTADEEDWGALFITVNGELREFRVAPADTTWGHIGFQYTSAVPYEHRIYEFAIPLGELNAQPSDELHYGFGAYGTAAMQYAGIDLENSDNNNVSRNRVTDNEDGIYLYNSFENNLTCNAVYKNMVGFYLDYGSVNNRIEHNSIVANMIEDPEEEEEVRNFINQQDPGVNATNNYWGTTVAAEIAASIIEDPGNVTYEPFLDEWPSCAPGVPLLEVTKTVWNGTVWVEGISDAYLNETVRFNCTITNIGGFNLTQLRFWDILDCSMVFAGNATLKNATGFILNDSIVLEDNYNYTFKPKVLHPIGYLNLSNPEVNFEELCPESQNLASHAWNDTDGDGNLSVCDQIQLENLEVRFWAHVDCMPYTLNVTNNETGESMYLESGQVDWVSNVLKALGHINYEEVDLKNPNYTYWLEAGWAEACCGRNWYQIDTWNDTDGDRNLSVNDKIQLWNQGIPDEEDLPWYNVTELAIDLVASREWDINDFADPDVLLEPGQSLTLEYNATDIDCGEDTNTFVAKGLYEGNWTYSNKDSAVVEVPPRPAVETNLTVWNGTAWAKAVTALVNDTLNFSWRIHNNGSCCDITVVKGTLTVASNKTEVDIAKRLAPCSEVNDTLEVPALECGTYTVWWNVTAKYSEPIGTKLTVKASDTVTVTVLCPELEVNKTVWNGTAWVKALTASINETVKFNCTITNTGNANLTQLRFWDILDCSLVYAGNTTLTNASGVKEEILTPPCLPSYCFKPQVLHPDEWWDPRDDPTGRNFTELCPQNNSRQIKNWEDTDHDGNLSVCDQVELSSAVPYHWYHVDQVPYTLNLSNANGTKYFESVFNWDDEPGLNFSDPVNSTWLEVCCSKDQYKLIGWNDSVSSGELTNGDNVTMQNQRTMEEVEYTVAEGVATDLVVSLEWELDNILHKIVTLEPNQTIMVEYNATVVRCGIDNNTFVAKGNYSGIWYYSDPDIVTITVPCPSADATDSAGAPMELYYTDETVYATGCGFKPNSTVNLYITEDKLWVYGMDINSTIYKRAENVSTNASGCVIGYPLWPNPNPGTFDLVIDANQDGKLDEGDGIDGFEGPGFMVLDRALSQVPAVTPQGMALLVGLLSIIATSTLVRRKKR